MKHLIKSLSVCLTFIVCSLGLNSVYACTISFAEWNMLYTEASTYARDQWLSPYDNTHVNLMVDWYDMDRGNWDNGWGWYAANDARRPFLRTMNALTLIRIAPYGGWYIGEDIDPKDAKRAAEVRDWLISAKNFSHNSLDELDGECRYGGRSARTIWGPFIDNYTNLYTPFYYATPLVEQAGVILHEAQHASWDGHDGGSGCINGASCDRTYAIWNANSLHVVYLWALTRSAYSLSEYQRQQAKARSIRRAARNFNSPSDISTWHWCVDRHYRSWTSSFPSCY